jgi:hypothetical protein
MDQDPAVRDQDMVMVRGRVGTDREVEAGRVWVKAADVAQAHEADVRVQGKYGVNYKSYWVNEAEGKVFCLVDAPDKETASKVHREAHGLEAHTLYEVEQGA